MSTSSDADLDYDGQGDPDIPCVYTNSFGFGFVTPTEEEESPQQSLAPNNEGCIAFHIDCQKAKSLEELQSKFNAAALKGTQASTGKNCLHFLTLNANLILSINKGNDLNRQSIDLDKASQLVDFMVDKICIVKEDKRCLLLETDHEGRIPFQEVMENWINVVEEKIKKNPGRRRNSILLRMSPSQSVQSNLHGSHRSPSQLRLLSSQETHHALFCLYLLSEMMQSLKAKVKQGEVPFLEWRNKSARMTKRRLFSKTPSSQLLSSRTFFSLSKTPTTSESIVNLCNSDYLSIAMVFKKVSEIDNLIKTLLTVVIGREEREAIFSMPLIQDVMIQPNSVGPWIIDMLYSSSDHTRTNVIDYLKRLSTLTENKRIDSDDSQLDELEDLAYKLGRLHRLIPSMMALSTRMIEEAATIPLITRALDKKMLSPFVSCALFFDIFGLGLLLISFRATVDSFNGEPLSPSAYYLANAAIYYFILRIWGKSISLYYFFKRYTLLHFRFSMIWVFLDTSSVLLSWICIWLIGYLGEKKTEVDLGAIRVLVAVTTMLLWLHLIETLTFINVKLATFVLAIRKITREIFWYLFLVACFGLCSSQVLYSLMIPDGDCIEENENDAGNIVDRRREYCSIRFYYTKVYAAVLGLDEWGFEIGDEDSPKFNKTLFSDIMYGIFSFIMIILLFNSLIAVISDSYESCLLQSKMLFGRARIQFLGDTLAFQNLYVRPSEVEKQRWSHGGCTFLISSMILYAGFVLFELYKPETDHKIWMYASFTLNACITFSFNVILAQQVQARAQEIVGGERTKLLFWPLNIIQWSVQRIIQWIMGTSLSYVDSNVGPGIWSGRVSYLKSEMDRVREENEMEMLNLKSDLRTQIKQSEIDVVDRLEKLLRNHQSEVLGRLEALEVRQRRSENES